MFILSNLATSLDGKIATSTREHFGLGTKKDLDEMKRLRKGVDAILMGASTLRAFKGPLLHPGKKQALNVIVSQKLEGIDPDWRFFKDERIERLLFVGPKSSFSKSELLHLKKFESSSEIVFQKNIRISSSVFWRDELALRQVKRLLVEGGGDVMWRFMKEDLINEIHLTLTPWILGGKSAPSLVEGEGFTKENLLSYKLKSLKKNGSELFLVYRRI